METIANLSISREGLRSVAIATTVCLYLAFKLCIFVISSHLYKVCITTISRTATASNEAFQKDVGND